MSQAKNFLFIHAGPGLNSEPERRILGPFANKMSGKFFFWDEPSAQRPDGWHFQIEAPLMSFRESLKNEVERIRLTDSAPLILVANSWTVRLAEDLIAQKPEWFEAAIFIAPTSQLQLTFEKMVEQLRFDFTRQGSELAAQIQAYQGQMLSFYDDATQAALALNAQDPDFFGHYWKNKAAFLEWVTALSTHPRYQYDPSAQTKVFSDLRANALRKVESTLIPLTLIFGDADPFVDQAKEVESYRTRFLNLKLQHFSQSSHFPHLEEPEKFLQVLQAL